LPNYSRKYRRTIRVSNYTTHFQKIKDSGINWVRMDVKKPISRSESVFREAHTKGLRIIAIIKSRDMLKGLGFGNENYLPKSRWMDKWKLSIQRAQNELGQYVKIWQIDNELNHPWHNPIPSINYDLALDIVKEGAIGIKNNNSQAKVAVNFFYKTKSLLKIPVLSYPGDHSLIINFKEQLQDKIDILGMDIYRGVWHLGKPADYPDDLRYFRKLWRGDIMIMETGYCTGITRSEAQQAQYVKNVFESLDGHMKDVSWFNGIMWYEYHSKHSGLPCEEYFGLHKKDGQTEKLAWKEFVRYAEKYAKYNKIIGLTYHY
jgi:hypothetical protein